MGSKSSKKLDKADHNGGGYAGKPTNPQIEDGDDEELYDAVSTGNHPVKQESIEEDLYDEVKTEKHDDESEDETYDTPIDDTYDTPIDPDDDIDNKKPPSRPISAGSKRKEGAKRKKSGIKSVDVGSIEEEPTIYENNLDETPLKPVPSAPKSVPGRKSSRSKPGYDHIDKMEGEKDSEAPPRSVPAQPKISTKKDDGPKRKQSVEVEDIESPIIYENPPDDAPLKAVPAPPKVNPRKKSSGLKPSELATNAKVDENGESEPPLRAVPPAPKGNSRKKSTGETLLGAIQEDDNSTTNAIETTDAESGQTHNRTPSVDQTERSPRGSIASRYLANAGKEEDGETNGGRKSSAEQNGERSLVGSRKSSFEQSNKSPRASAASRFQTNTNSVESKGGPRFSANDRAGSISGGPRFSANDRAGSVSSDSRFSANTKGAATSRFAPKSGAGGAGGAGATDFSKLKFNISGGGEIQIDSKWI